VPKITLSYRRNDSGVIVGRIFDLLATRYGRNAVFRDIDNIPPGVDFRTHIAQVLSESDVLLAIIGPEWLGSTSGFSRLSDDTDPVRAEIEISLHQNLPIIPVLVLGAEVPPVSALPVSIQDFAYRSAVRIDAGQDFDVHTARLMRGLDGLMDAKISRSLSSIITSSLFIRKILIALVFASFVISLLFILYNHYDYSSPKRENSRKYHFSPRKLGIVI
jgi:TIR domain